MNNLSVLTKNAYDREIEIESAFVAKFTLSIYYNPMMTKYTCDKNALVFFFGRNNFDMLNKITGLDYNFLLLFKKMQ